MKCWLNEDRECPCVYIDNPTNWCVAATVTQWNEGRPQTIDCRILKALEAIGRFK